MRHFKLALAKSNPLGESIRIAGGAVLVVGADFKKVALKDKDGGDLANPVALNYGQLEFYTADDVVSVDLYGLAPTGHAIKQVGVVPSGNNEIYVDTCEGNTVVEVPVHAEDYTAGSENDTGLDLVTGSVVVAGAINVEVNTVDATETLDVGTLSSESNGDADRFIAAASVATAGTVMSTTLSASFAVAPGDATSLSITPSAGSDTFAGVVKLPVQLPAGSVG